MSQISGQRGLTTASVVSVLRSKYRRLSPAQGSSRRSAPRFPGRAAWPAVAALLCLCWLLLPASALAAGAPTVSGLSVGSGPMSGGTSVTISGAGFTGATAVMFGTQASPSFTVNSDGSITATSPQDVGASLQRHGQRRQGLADASAPVDVTVTTPAGTSATASADRFTYNWVLTVASGSQRKVYTLSDLEAMSVYSGYGGYHKSASGNPPFTTYPYTGVTLLNLLADSGGYASGRIAFGTADNFGMAPYTYSDVTDPFDNFGAYDPTQRQPPRQLIPA